jgi:hypothetical protein
MIHMAMARVAIYKDDLIACIEIRDRHTEMSYLSKLSSTEIDTFSSH